MLFHSWLILYSLESLREQQRKLEEQQRILREEQQRKLEEQQRRRAERRAILDALLVRLVNPTVVPNEVQERWLGSVDVMTKSEAKDYLSRSLKSEYPVASAQAVCCLLCVGFIAARNQPSKKE